MRDAPFAWTEEAVTGGIQQTSASFGHDFGNDSLNILVDWDDLATAILYIVGYSEIVPVVANGVTTRALHRNLPARNPRYPGMYASKIQSIAGVGVVGKTTSGNGTWGAWEKARISILFELFPYPILQDAEVRYEFQRYTKWDFDTSLETLARRGVSYYFLTPNGSPPVPGDSFVKTPKSMLKLTWYDVPKQYIFQSGIEPTNWLDVVGKVNLYPFPPVGAYVDPTTGASISYPPGTLLCMPPKTTWRSQVAPSIFQPANINPNLFPHTCDVEFTFQLFNPPLAASVQAPNPVAQVLVEPPDGNVGVPVVVPIQGHNSAPQPVAVQVAGQWGQWYAMAAGAGNPPVAPVIGTPVPTDLSLLYQYADFGLLFRYVGD